MIRELEKKLNYSFKNTGLLLDALTHSSYANECRDPRQESNERLEFLGDAILGLIVASYLYANYNSMAEGKMTRMRAELVCEANLNKVARELDLGRYMRFGKGEEHTGGRTRPSILADCTEAVIAAMYLDGGMSVAEEFINRYILCELKQRGEERYSDYKTALQELIQQKSGQALSYAMLSESGPDHNKVFTAQVCLNGEPIGVGTGHSKKEAEQAAARKALEERK